MALSTNYFECPHCNGPTRQIEISAEEYFAICAKNSSTLEQILARSVGVFNDYVPVIKLIGKPYKCSKCLNIKVRAPSGEILEELEDW